MAKEPKMKSPKINSKSQSPRTPACHELPVTANTSSNPLFALNKHYRHHSYSTTTTPKRRSSSFASGNSSWSRRRSFLSSSMMSNERHSVYKVLHTYTSIPTYSISLSESQGFSWNQDLFATNQEQEAGVIYDGCKDIMHKYDDDFNDVFYDDENEDQDAVMSNSGGRRSYSMSNDDGYNRVKVINIEVDEDDNLGDIFQSDI